VTGGGHQPFPQNRSDRPRRRSEQIVVFIGVIGRVFVAAGLLLLFFTAYLLGGTNVYTKKEQEQATRRLASNPIVSEAQLAGGKIPPARPKNTAALGSPLFKLDIPKIGLETAVVQGVGREELKKGPGHFPTCEEIGKREDCVSETKYPGEKGNVALSGHRTTYGAPFFRLNELAEGDLVDFVSGRARYRYKVRSQEIVDPTAGFQVVEQHGRDELTLTTCHPRFSAAQRLVIHADYVGASLISGGGGPQSGPSRSAPRPVIPTDTLVLASIAGASALASLGLSKRYRAAAGYIAVGIVGAAGMWIAVFPRVLHLMPSNF
jgi:sortase A